MKNIKFYFFLVNKKARTKIHNIFEKKVKNVDIISTIDLLSYFEKFFDQRIVTTDIGAFFKTNVINNNKPMTLAQARIILGSCNLYKNNINPKKNSQIAKELTSFLITTKDENGLYKFNQKNWYLQDEGIATIWTLIALLEVYKLWQDKNILTEIISTLAVLNEKMFSKKNSLAHTLGDDYWCLNAASTYAWFVSELLNFYTSEELLENLEISIKVCNSKITDAGYFPYSERKPGTYLLLYNPVVIYTLENAIKNKKINKSLKETTMKNIIAAKNFLLNQMDSDNFFIEPEMKNFSRYIISNITSLVALTDFVSDDLTDKIFSNIKSYFINNKMFLCRDDDDLYFNGNLYEVNDVLMTEVFYWLTIFLKTKKYQEVKV